MSSDGMTWHGYSGQPVFGYNTLRPVCWCPGIDLFVAGAYGNILATTPNGVTWTRRELNFANNWIHSMAWSPKLQQLVVTGQQTPRSYESTFCLNSLQNGKNRRFCHCFLVSFVMAALFWP